MADRSNPARLCFGCGNENPHGMGMHFRQDGERAVAEFTVEPRFQGYPGQAHGGVVATMLDEAMSWAVYYRGAWSMTAKMELRFRAPVPLGETLTASGWITRDRGRFLELRSELRDAAGRLLAESSGLFARVQGKQAEALRAQYEAALAE